MRVFLTGGTGFVGSAVLRALADRGHEVFALVRQGRPLEAATVVSGDLLDEGSYAPALRDLRPDVVLHLAWYAVPKDYLTSRENLRWVTATLRLAEITADLGHAHFVGAGTCFEYDTAGDAPLAEASATGPRHLYSACKLATSIVLEELLPKGSFCWARIFYLYGPREPPSRLVPSVVRALRSGLVAEVSEGRQRRDFLHVDDVARALVTISEERARGIVNVGSGRAVSVRDVVATVARLLGREDRVAYGAIPARAGDPDSVVADARKLADLGFRPTHDLESGLLDTLAWYQAEKTS